MTDHAPFMARAIDLALFAQDAGEVPVGAVVVHDGNIIGEGCNVSISAHDPTGHAEMNAIRNAAASIGNYRLAGATLYVTLEPCAMCAGAIIHARIETVVFGARDERVGAAGGAMSLLESPLMNHRCRIVSGVERYRCEQLLVSFFQSRR